MSTEYTLNIPTATHNQVVLFDTPLDASLLRQYDHILLVIDQRVRGIKDVGAFVDNIKKLKKEVRETSFHINSFIKNTNLLLTVLDSMACFGLTRKSLIIAIGGGSIGDLVGVAASMYMRGIDYAVIPTNYISMTDGIIGKVAVNHAGHKNLIGSFKSPIWILINSSLLGSLPKREIYFGLVEVWKHTLITNNATKREKVENILLNGAASNELIELAMWSMTVKSKFVLPDWNDTNSVHKALSLGHTLANYLEESKHLFHAEAVMYGIVFEVVIAKKLGAISDGRFDEIIKTAVVFEREFRKLDSIKHALLPKTLHDFLLRDKISHHNSIIFTLPTDHGYTVKEIDEEILSSTIKEFNDLKLT